MDEGNLVRALTNALSLGMEQFRPKQPPYFDHPLSPGGGYIVQKVDATYTVNGVITKHLIYWEAWFVAEKDRLPDAVLNSSDKDPVIGSTSFADEWRDGQQAPGKFGHNCNQCGTEILQPWHLQEIGNPYPKIKPPILPDTRPLALAQMEATIVQTLLSTPLGGSGSPMVDLAMIQPPGVWRSAKKSCYLC